MPNYAGGARAVCPFYQWEAGKSITCEGPVDGVTIMSRFPSTAEKQAFQADFCETYSYGRRCLLARALETKYREDETPTDR